MSVQFFNLLSAKKEEEGTNLSHFLQTTFNASVLLFWKVYRIYTLPLCVEKNDSVIYKWTLATYSWQFNQSDGENVSVFVSSFGERM